MLLCVFQDSPYKFHKIYIIRAPGMKSGQPCFYRIFPQNNCDSPAYFCSGCRYYFYQPKRRKNTNESNRYRKKNRRSRQSGGSERDPPRSADTGGRPVTSKIISLFWKMEKSHVTLSLLYFSPLIRAYTYSMCS